MGAVLTLETLVADFERRDRFTLLALAGWTLFVWVGRIRNVVAGEFESLAFAWRLGVAAGFSLVALGLVVLVLTRSSLARPVGGGLALIGALWWLIRGGGILLADAPIDEHIGEGATGVSHSVTKLLMGDHSRNDFVMPASVTSKILSVGI